MTDLVLQDDVVRAALEYIDHFDDEEPLELPQSPPQRSTAKRQRVTSSQRVRTEIQRLRSLASELEVRLQQLQQETNACLTPIRRWEDLALQRKLERQHAETENIRLRESLRKQTRAMRQIQNVLVRGRRLRFDARFDDSGFDTECLDLDDVRLPCVTSWTVEVRSQS